jgi:hypothetical protein
VNKGLCHSLLCTANMQERQYFGEVLYLNLALGQDEHSMDEPWRLLGLFARLLGPRGQ